MSKKKLLLALISLVLIIATQVYFLTNYDHFKAEGGLKVELEFDPNDITKKYARATLDFDYVMKDAVRTYEQKGGDFLTIFAESNEKRSKKPLVQLFNYKEIPRLSRDSKDDEVINLLRDKLNANLNSAKSFYQTRMERTIDKPLVFSSNDKKLTLTMEVLGRKDSLNPKYFEIPQVNIGFYECVSPYEFSRYWNNACEALELDSISETNWELTDLNKASVVSQQKLSNTVQWNIAGSGTVKERDKEFVDSKVHSPEVDSLFPKNFEFRWSSSTEQSAEGKIWLLYVIRIPDTGSPVISNEDINSATLEWDEYNGQNSLMISMTQEGSEKWSIMTEENINRQIAMCINGVVFSAPNVIGQIRDGRTQISGGEVEELKDIETVLNYRSLEINPIRSMQTFVKADPPLLNSLIQQFLLAVSILILLFLTVQYFRTSRAV